MSPEIICSLDLSFGSFLYIKIKKGTYLLLGKQKNRGPRRRTELGAAKVTKEKGSLRLFLGLAFSQQAAHYNSFATLTQTVMLEEALPFSASKMQIFFQK
jgi:hypothetical protein